MKISRRRACTAGVAALSSRFLIGRSRARNGITVTGRLTTRADSDVSGLRFRLSNVETDDDASVTLDSSGEIRTTVAEPGTFRVTVFDYSAERNSLPAVYSFANIDIGEDGDIGTFTIPEAHRVDIRCLDTEGDPVADVGINFRAPNGTGMGPGNFVTTTDGFVKYRQADEQGVELAGEVDIEAQAPADPENIEFLKTVTVSEPDTVAVTVPNPEAYRINVQEIAAHPDDGFYFPYYLYTPPSKQPANGGDDTSDRADPRPIVVGFRRWDSVAERSEKIADARDGLTHGSTVRAIAEELEIPAMIATLPESTSDRRFEGLDREALRICEPPSYERLDLQLFSMVDDAKRRLADRPYEIADEIHLDGFSSNGRLCDRLSILHPERINAVSNGGTGVNIIPKSEYDGDIPVRTEPETTTLGYPVGTAGVPELVGEEFDRQAWLDVAIYRYIGAEDQGDPDRSDLGNDYRHAPSFDEYSEKRQQLLYDVFGWKQVDERFETSRRILEAVGANATFRTYDGVGHTVSSDMLTDVVEFHRRQIVSSEFTTGSLRDEPEPACEVSPSSAAGSSPSPSKAAETSPTSTGKTQPAAATAEPSTATDTSQPGFGLLETLAALGSLWYLVQSRIGPDSD